jgi:hypothetical protein
VTYYPAPQPVPPDARNGVLYYVLWTDLLDGVYPVQVLNPADGGAWVSLYCPHHRFIVAEDHCLPRLRHPLRFSSEDVRGWRSRAVGMLADRLRGAEPMCICCRPE